MIRIAEYIALLTGWFLICAIVNDIMDSRKGKNNHAWTEWVCGYVAGYLIANWIGAETWLP